MDLYFKPCYVYGMRTSAPGIVNIIIECGPDSVVDQYTLFKPTKSAFSQHYLLEVTKQQSTF